MRSFLPPCGDKLKCMSIVTFKRGDTFPSPCGDKLKSCGVYYYCKAVKFPSPCGDKLKSKIETTITTTVEPFPSPCGDKLKSSRNVNSVSYLMVFVPLRG